MRRRQEPARAPVDRHVPAGRDLTIDLARVLCLFVVVAAHITFTALRPGPDGAPVSFLPMQELPFFAELAWFGQPMPLFFVIGGFAGITAWRSAQRRGVDAWEFFRGRLVRLAWPAAGYLLIITTVVWIPVLAGMPRSLADAALHGVGLPLWFIGAFLLCQAALPLLAECHRRHPWRTVALLLGGAALTDGVRLVTGQSLVGLPNYLFVWPLIQQIGFFLADGWFDPGPTTPNRRFVVRRRQLVLVMVISFTMVGLTGTLLPYGGDLLQNQIPPTLPLIGIAVGHTAALRLLSGPLTQLTARRGVQAVMFLIGSRAMTLYLWHVIFVILIAAAFFFLPGLPQPPGAGWWWTRPVVMIVVLSLVLLVSLAVGRWERGPRPEALRPITSDAERVRLVLAGVLAVLLPFATVVTSLDTAIVLIGTAAILLCCLLLIRLGGRLRTSPVPAEDVAR